MTVIGCVRRIFPVIWYQAPCSRFRACLIKHTCLALGCLWVIFVSPHPASAQTRSVFLWVECEGTNRTLDSLGHVQGLLADAKAWGIDTLFVQVYRGDKAWFDCRACDASPLAEFQRREGKDMLHYLLDQAHRQGIGVFAWVNCFRLSKDPNGPLIRKLGKRIITRDNKGRSMLSYPNLQLPGEDNKYYEADSTGYWMDPGDPDAQNHLLTVFRELMTKYPSLDGVQLDFVRLPYVVPFSPGARFPKGITYGYGERSVARFRAATKWDPLHWDGSSASALAWDDWRRNQITEFVRKVHGLQRELLPKGRLSAAVLCWGDRAFLSAFQDWRSWLLDGDLDFVAIMNYSIETKLFSHVTREAFAFARVRPVWIGLGPYLLGQRENIFRAQVEDTLQQLWENNKGALGFFSYDSLKQTPQLIPILKSTIAKNGSGHGTNPSAR